MAKILKQIDLEYGKMSSKFYIYVFVSFSIILTNALH